MVNTGLIRKIDKLGRIVIPKEIRKNLNIKDGEELEIYVENDNIILKKYHRLLTFKDVVISYINLFNKLMPISLIVTDREYVIFSNKNDFKVLENKKVGNNLNSIFEERKIGTGINLNICEDSVIKGNYYIKPIIVNTDLVGSIICISEKEITNQDKLIVDIIDSLIKIKLETD